MKIGGWLFLGALVFFISCASMPSGGPTKYAQERSTKFADLPLEEGGEELKFGLFCVGKKCSENYKVNAAGWIPLPGMALLFQDTPSTMKAFISGRKYQSLTWLSNFNDYQDSDLIIKLNIGDHMNAGTADSADVISAYSRRSLYQLKGGRISGSGKMIYDAFKPGTRLHQAVLAEREAYLKRQEQPQTVASGGGISKDDLEAILRKNAEAQKPAPQGVSTEDLKRILQEQAEAAEAKRKAAEAAEAERKAAEAAPAFNSDVDNPQYQLSENPNDYAVVIGIEKYSNIDVPATFAERDAQAVTKHLIALGYPPRNIRTLLGEKATRAALKQNIERWLSFNVKEDSRVFFYFSGHGAPDTKAGEPYLVPRDGDPSDLPDTAYLVKDLYKKLHDLKAQEVLIALDSCFSGGGGRSVLPKGARPLVTTKIDTEDFPKDKLTLFAAAAGDQITSTKEDQGHGIFTYYFLKGLDEAAKKRFGNTTAQTLFDALKIKVADEAAHSNREQTPVLRGAETLSIIHR